MDKYNQLWHKIKLHLADILNDNTYHELMQNIDTDILKFENNHVYVKVKNAFTESKINMLYLSKINTIANELFEDKIDFVFISEDKLNDFEIIPTAPIDTQKTDYLTTSLSRNFTFDNFVVGKSNNYAFKVAMKVADQPGVVHNPLYIFGGVGLGKTHLMQAIGNYIISSDLNKKIIYAKADNFIEDYKYFLDTKNPLGFYNKYRSVDILLMDDIQMLSRAEKSQNEFFKIFDTLKNNNKQIVITADCAPKNLKDIMERLTSRFQESLIINIEVPDLQHRVEILRRELKTNYDPEKVPDVPSNCLDYIADNFVTNVRELKGALTSAMTFCEVNKLPVNLSSFKKGLSLLLQTKKRTSTLSENNLDKVQSIVAEYYEVSISELISKSKKYKIALARQIAMYLIRQLYNIPFKKIGEIFGNRDHSTVMSAVDNIDRELKHNQLMVQAVTSLIKKITGK